MHIDYVIIINIYNGVIPQLGIYVLSYMGGMM